MLSDRGKKPLWAAACFSILVAFSGSGCASVLKSIDVSGLRDIRTRLTAERMNGTPLELTDYLRHVDPFGGPVTEMAAIKVEALGRWSMKSSAHPEIVQERLSYPSSLGDRAVFYLYHEGGLAGKKAILWVPGYGVSDFAFSFIKTFFRAELDRGYAILFYTIPYHLERTVKGKAAGEGFLSLDTVRNLETFTGAIADLRSGLAYLRAEGVASVSGWGGSVGAAFLWTLSSKEKLDHLALMIPVVDWTTLLFHPELEPVLKNLENMGYTKDLLGRAYGLFSPFGIDTLTDPDKIHLSYGRLDQLTPEARILEFAHAKGIADTKGYRESHGSILLNRRMYEDYRTFLDRIGP